MPATDATACTIEKDKITGAVIAIASAADLRNEESAKAFFLKILMALQEHPSRTDPHLILNLKHCKHICPGALKELSRVHDHMEAIGNGNIEIITSRPSITHYLHKPKKNKPLGNIVNITYRHDSGASEEINLDESPALKALVQFKRGDTALQITMLPATLRETDDIALTEFHKKVDTELAEKRVATVIVDFSATEKVSTHACMAMLRLQTMLKRKYNAGIQINKPPKQMQKIMADMHISRLLPTTALPPDSLLADAEQQAGTARN